MAQYIVHFFDWIWNCKNYKSKSILLIYICLVVSFTPLEGNAKTIQQETDSIFSPNYIINTLSKSYSVRNRISLSNKNLLIGKQAPPLHLERWLRPPLEKFTWPTDKFTYLFFWDIYCGACMGQLSEMNVWARRIEAEGGRFISIHTFVEEDRIPSIEKVLKERNISFPVAIDKHSEHYFCWQSKTCWDYFASSLPTYCAIGADGRLLSYQSPGFFDWQNEIKGVKTQNHSDQIQEPRPLTVTPLDWMVNGVKPATEISKSFLLYRPDTPNLTIKELSSSDPNVILTYKKYSDRGQTVFVINGKTTALIWNKAYKGTISIKVVYDERSDVLEIPFQIISPPLVKPPATMYFGIIEKGKDVTKLIKLQSNVLREKLTIKTISMPNWVTVQLPESIDKGNGIIPLKIRCQSNQAGILKDHVKLKVLYSKGLAEQLVQIRCVAIVREAERGGK